MAAVAERKAVKPAHEFDKVLGAGWRDPRWRLRNLYWIIDKDSKVVRFVPNEEQEDFLDNYWTRNLILKARQLGFSTLMAMLELDQALFNFNYNGVIIADTLPNAGKLFGKVEFAYDHLPAPLREAVPTKSRTTRSEIVFVNGSSIGVGVSARGGTVQNLHVSELGKIAAKAPIRAAEIVTGAFESVSLDNFITVESTAEGAVGEFYELVMPALKRYHEGAPETKLDWRLHFFPWWRRASYSLTPEDAALVPIEPKDELYFRGLTAKTGHVFTTGQKAWYVKKRETLARKMKQEYPSTPEEAFEVAIEGAVYGEEMTSLREKGRITDVPLDINYPVNSFWDLGKRDMTAIWLHQHIGLQDRWFWYHEDNNKDLNHFWTLLDQKRIDEKFRWGRHFLPHDAATEILGKSITTHQRTLVDLGMRNETVVPRIQQLSLGIDLTRKALAGNHWFDRVNAAQGIKCLDGYQFGWSETMLVWTQEPLHNWASHGADA